jgi:hypothetical protein
MELISQIKKKGHRVTQSRELICKILEDSGHAHFTVDEIYQKVIKKKYKYRPCYCLQNFRTIGRNRINSTPSPGSRFGNLFFKE